MSNNPMPHGKTPRSRRRAARGEGHHLLVAREIRAAYQGEREVLLQRWGHLCREMEAIDNRLSELDELLSPI